MDPTHIGLFDTSMTSSIPNVVCMSPSKEDYLSALNWAIEQKDHPIIMRVPFESSEEPLSLNFQLQTFEPFKSKILKSGEKIAIFAVQKTLHIAQKLSNAIKSALGIEATIAYQDCKRQTYFAFAYQISRQTRFRRIRGVQTEGRPHHHAGHYPDGRRSDQVRHR